jgi:hypothetical protein
MVNSPPIFERAIEDETLTLTLLRYPPVNEEQKKALGAWFPSRTPATGMAKIPKILANIEGVYGKKTWAAIGVFSHPLLT